MVKLSIFAAERRQVACTSLKLPEYEDAMKEYLQHFRLRYGYGFLGFGWMITPMNDGWRLDPKESKRSIHKSQIYGNLIQLDARFEVIVHIWTSYKNVFQLSAERFSYRNMDLVCVAAQRRSQIVWDILSLEQQPMLG